MSLTSSSSSDWQSLFNPEWREETWAIRSIWSSDGAAIPSIEQRCWTFFTELLLLRRRRRFLRRRDLQSVFRIFRLDRVEEISAGSKECLGPTTRSYRRRQQQNAFQFNNHSTQNHPQSVRWSAVISLVNLSLSVSDHSHTGPTSPVSLPLSHLDYRNLSRQWTSISVASNGVSERRWRILLHCPLVCLQKVFSRSSDAPVQDWILRQNRFSSAEDERRNR